MLRALLLALTALPLFAAAPTSWTAVRGISFPDPTVQRQGHKVQAAQPLETSDAYVKSAAVHLQIGKPYELSGYIRTEALEALDSGRSPIVTGASLAMASMPFDVHSESMGGTQDWNRVALRFVATRSEDAVVFKVAEGGSFKGRAWFDGVTVEPASAANPWPTKAAVRTYGPAYRYPQGGWIYLHIEGEPYERGYQHGMLMAKEIPEYLERCAADYDPQAKDWKQARDTANALFLRGFDQEILAEMKGIADGASDGGAKFLGRRIDVIDIAAANTIVEMGELREALQITPTGLELLHLQSPAYANAQRELGYRERCSAFAATGKATRDGKMVIAHTTFWPLTLAERTNVMLDIKPAKGRRIVMQSYPGGIESGTDWYQNDAGMVLTETTIRQSPFNSEGTPIAYRARKAIQYGENVDQIVEHLTQKNNGLYTNEWLIGDAKNDEIALYELGTRAAKLWRSTKNEWFGDTEGFYWGNNNAKDLNVRLELMPDPRGAHEHVPYVPGDRDLKWRELYDKYKGQIDEQFAFLAFRTAPLVSSSAMDAKVVTSAMAAKMLVWGVFGKPNEREWVPTEWQKQAYSKNDGIYSSGYRLFSTEPPAALGENEPKPAAAAVKPIPASPLNRSDLWKGWILPATSADTWLSAGAEALYADLQSDDPERAEQTHWAGLRAAKLAEPRTALDDFAVEKHRGAILLNTLRKGMGNDRFLRMMRDYFAANTTKPVEARAFLDAAKTTATLPPDKGGPDYLASDIRRRLATALIVYGTTADACANRYAAEQLQRKFLNSHEAAVPIVKDFELADAALQGHDAIFVGRPETNSALAGFRVRMDLDFNGASFRLNGNTHASETESLIIAKTNPTDPAHMILILAGNSALETVRLAAADPARAEYAVLDSGRVIDSGFRTLAGPANERPSGFAHRVGGK